MTTTNTDLQKQAQEAEARFLALHDNIILKKVAAAGFAVSTSEQAGSILRMADRLHGMVQSGELKVASTKDPLLAAEEAFNAAIAGDQTKAASSLAPESLASKLAMDSGIFRDVLTIRRAQAAELLAG